MGKYLDKHFELTKKGYTDNGLCYEKVDGEELSTNPKFIMLTPSDEERWDGGYSAYWADDYENDDVCQYGPTRQNIVLFMAAMNNEL